MKRRGILSAAAGLMMAVVAVACVNAQPSPPPDDPTTGPAPPTPPALSRECQTPGIAISGDLPLPNVTNALRLRKTIRILAIGASSKGGKNNADAGYQALIEAAIEQTVPGLDVQIINRGVSGELARDAGERIKTEVALAKPDLVLWQLGTHDAMAHVPVEDFRASVAETLDWLREHDVDVVMVGLHYLRNMVRDPHYQKIRLAVREIAEGKRVLWIGRYEAQQVIDQARRAAKGPSPNEFTLTDAGYACLAEYVARAVTSGMYAKPPRALPKK